MHTKLCTPSFNCSMLKMKSYFLLLCFWCFHSPVDKSTVFADLLGAGRNNCSDIESCSGKCGQKTGYRECKCDKACLLYGDCCFDYVKHCLGMSDEHLEEEMQIYYSKVATPDTVQSSIPDIGNVTSASDNACHHAMPWTLEYGNVSDVLLDRGCITCYWPYHLVAVCPKLWTDDETREICETKRTSIYRPPVHDIEFKTISYRNVHCAFCHGRRLDQLELWQSKLNCPRETNLETLIEDTVFLRDNCSVKVKPNFTINSASMFRRMCSFAFDKTSQQMKSGTDTCSCYQSHITILPDGDIEHDICGTNFAEPENSVVGVFAAWCCLYAYSPPKYGGTLNPLPSGGQNGPRPISISLLFSLEPRKRPQIVHKDKAVILTPPSDIECGPDEVYMFVLQRCQKIGCGEGYSIRNGECILDSILPTSGGDNCTAIVSIQVHAVVFHGETKDSEVENTLVRFLRWVDRAEESVVCTGDTLITQEKNDSKNAELEGWENALMHRLSLIEYNHSSSIKNKTCLHIPRIEPGPFDNWWRPEIVGDSVNGNVEAEWLTYWKKEIRRLLNWRSGSWRTILSLMDFFQCLAEESSDVWVNNEDGSAIQFISVGITNFNDIKDFRCNNVMTFSNFTYKYPSKADELFIRLHSIEKDYNAKDVRISEQYRFGPNIKNQHCQSATICNRNNDTLSLQNCSQAVGLNPGEYTVDVNGVVTFENGDNKYKATVYKNISDTLYVCNQTESVIQNDNDNTNLVFWESLLSYIGSGLSLVALLITIVTYSLFRELRNIPGKVVMCLAVNVFVAVLLFVSAAWRTDLPSFCAFLAMILHYFWLSAFFLMNVLSFDIAKTFGTGKMSKRREESHTFLKYCLYAFGVPVVAIAATLIEGYLTKSDAEDGFYNYGSKHEKICWINTFVMLYVFYIPVALTLLGNIIMFIRTVIGIHRVSKLSKIARNLSDDKNNILLYLKLSLVMGLGWIAVVLSDRLGIQIVSVIFAVANTFQGVFIFLAFICNARVYRMYKRVVTKQVNIPSSSVRAGTNTSSSSGLRSRRDMSEAKI